MSRPFQYLTPLPQITIAIDGPAAAGKTTLAKNIAAGFGITYVDTGAMFRAVALHALRMELKKRGVQRWIIRDLSNELVDEALRTIDLKVECNDPAQTIYLDGEPIADEELRTSDIAILASDISRFPQVRDFLLKQQREIAAYASVVMEGRDIGSIVLPNATCKFYLDADLLVRAQRRYLELRKTLSDLDPLKVANDLAKRDHQDRTRKTAPLCVAEGAMVIDSTERNAEAVYQQVAELIENCLKEKLS